MSRVEPFWPRMSVSVTISSPAPGASRPWSSRPVVTVTTPAPGGQRVIPGATRAATSAAPSCSARRCADPTPAVTATTRRPADSAAWRSVTSALPSPRYAGVAVIGQGDRVRVDRQRIAGQVGELLVRGLAGCRHAERARGPPGDPEVVGGVAHLLDGPVGRSTEVDRGLVADGGVVPGRGEELVARGHEVVGLGADQLRVAEQDQRGCRRTRCGPGRRSGSPCRRPGPGTSASIPSTAIPSASLEHISVSSEWRPARTAARSRTAGVSSSSRHGGAQSPCRATSSERWSATRK